MAALYLGRLLGEQGDLEGAKAAYQQAIDTNHAKWAPIAAKELEQLKSLRPLQPRKRMSLASCQ